MGVGERAMGVGERAMGGERRGEEGGVKIGRKGQGLREEGGKTLRRRHAPAEVRVLLFHFFSR